MLDIPVRNKFAVVAVTAELRPHHHAEKKMLPLQDNPGCIFRLIMRSLVSDGRGKLFQSGPGRFGLMANATGDSGTGTHLMRFQATMAIRA